MKHNLINIIYSLFFILLFSCSDNSDLDLIEKSEYQEQVEQKKSKKNLQFVTYNIHGGKGPGGEGDLNSNLTRFKGLLKDEKILFFQEVKPEHVNDIKNIFNEFYHVFYTETSTVKKFWNWSSFSHRSKKEGILTLSKIPFKTTHSKEIQIDPGGDKWRRNAQHVSIDFNGKKLDFFHYHNTYNWNIDDFQSEKEGIQKFKAYATARLNTKYINDSSILLGDYNIFSNDVKEILKTRSHFYDGRDHINTHIPLVKKGKYNTVSLKLSDHNAVWGRISI